jgi:hypothetical protein
MEIVKTNKTVYEPVFDPSTGKYKDVSPFEYHSRNNTVYTCLCNHKDFNTVTTFKIHINTKAHIRFIENYDLHIKETSDAKSSSIDYQMKSELLDRKCKLLEQSKKELECENEKLKSENLKLMASSIKYELFEKNKYELLEKKYKNLDKINNELQSELAEYKLLFMILKYKNLKQSTKSVDTILNSDGFMDCLEEDLNDSVYNDTSNEESV